MDPGLSSLPEEFAPMLAAGLLALAAQPPAAGPWIEFDRRPAGWADSPYEYDAGSVRREGPRVRVTYRHKYFLSGLPDPQFRVGIEINCARRRARVYESLVDNGLPRPRALGPDRRRAYRRNVPAIATPIASGSIEESLARRLCPDYRAAEG